MHCNILYLPCTHSPVLYGMQASKLSWDSANFRESSTESADVWRLLRAAYTCSSAYGHATKANEMGKLIERQPGKNATTSRLRPYNEAGVSGTVCVTRSDSPLCKVTSGDIFRKHRRGCKSCDEGQRRQRLVLFWLMPAWDHSAVGEVRCVSPFLPRHASARSWHEAAKQVLSPWRW